MSTSRLSVRVSKSEIAEDSTLHMRFANMASVLTLHTTIVVLECGVRGAGDVRGKRLVKCARCLTRSCNRDASCCTWREGFLHMRVYVCVCVYFVCVCVYVYFVYLYE